MKSPVKAIQAWRSGRELRALQQWTQIRVKGKGRFVFRTALYYGIAMVGISDALDRIFTGGSEKFMLFKLAFFVLCGTWIAHDAWSTREHKYQEALHEARAKALSEKS
jgi:hypothetical protein